MQDNTILFTYKAYMKTILEMLNLQLF